MNDAKIEKWLRAQEQIPEVKVKIDGHDVILADNPDPYFDAPGDEHLAFGYYVCSATIKSPADSGRPFPMVVPVRIPVGDESLADRTPEERHRVRISTAYRVASDVIADGKQGGFYE